MEEYAAEKPTWCPGCGNFALRRALIRSLERLEIPPEQLALVTGIGCAGTIASTIRSYAFHGLHGRTLPVATGIKLANPRLTVVAVGGDGDGYAIGLSHLIHSIRRNVDVTYMVMDNHVYGLTTGQASPTTEKGFVTRATPAGVIEEPVMPLLLALGAGITFLAQGFSGDPVQLEELIVQGISHKGFALINVISPCVTFRKEYGVAWYRERIKSLDEDPTHDSTSKESSLRKIEETKGFCTGMVFRAPPRPSWEELLLPNGLPPIERDLRLTPQEVEGLIDHFRICPSP